MKKNGELIHDQIHGKIVIDSLFKTTYVSLGLDIFSSAEG